MKNQYMHFNRGQIITQLCISELNSTLDCRIRRRSKSQALVPYLEFRTKLIMSSEIWIELLFLLAIGLIIIT